jgi:hypothetical protein
MSGMEGAMGGGGAGHTGDTGQGERTSLDAGNGDSEGIGANNEVNVNGQSVRGGWA